MHQDELVTILLKNIVFCSSICKYHRNINFENNKNCLFSVAVFLVKTQHSGWKDATLCFLTVKPSDFIRIFQDTELCFCPDFHSLCFCIFVPKNEAANMRGEGKCIAKLYGPEQCLDIQWPPPHLFKKLDSAPLQNGPLLTVVCLLA